MKTVSCECEENQKNSLILTEEPVLLKKGTDGTAGPDGKYVLFGDWPQSLKREDVTIDESKTYKVNEWNCYKGSDGNYYVKEAAKPFIIEDDVNFMNGETVVKDKEYYFKVESIKWRILDNNYEGGKLLLSEKALCGCCFDKHIYLDFNNPNQNLEESGIERKVNGYTVYGNNYEYSTIRAFLNGLNGWDYDVEDFRGRGFINKAFSKKAIGKINTVTVDNSAKSATDSGNHIITEDDYVCRDTKDKIFLLSEREVTKKSYGFDSYNIGTGDKGKTKTSSRSIEFTDYSLATGIYKFDDHSYGNSCCWWLRSPADDIVLSARAVYFGGPADDWSMNCINNDDVGVVPALSISF